ncbi:MAG: hypothetical protein EAY65_02885 [Alphaproteobacteria bacterium]|nr:MAG: hypothetical protein EAY65_02885 [Alphaproteobacteria bacterium]
MNNEELWKQIGDAIGLTATVGGAGYAAKTYHDQNSSEFIKESLMDWTEKEKQLYKQFFVSDDLQKRVILSRIAEGKAYAFIEKFTEECYASKNPKSMETLAQYALVRLEKDKQGLVRRVKSSGFSGLVAWKAKQIRNRSHAVAKGLTFLERHEERVKRFRPFLWQLDPSELYDSARKYLTEQQIARDQLTTLSQYIDDNVMLVSLIALFFSVFSLEEFLEFAGDQCTLIDANKVNSRNIDEFTAMIQEAMKTVEW